jgi:hypothetical protein
VVNFGEFCHDIDLSLMFWYFVEHFLFHKLDSNDPVLREVVALIDDSVVSLAQLLGTIDIKIVVDFLHALHCYKDKIIQLHQQTQ